MPNPDNAAQWAVAGLFGGGAEERVDVRRGDVQIPEAQKLIPRVVRNLIEERAHRFVRQRPVDAPIAELQAPRLLDGGVARDLSERRRLLRADALPEGSIEPREVGRDHPEHLDERIQVIEDGFRIFKQRVLRRHVMAVAVQKIHPFERFASRPPQLLADIVDRRLHHRYFNSP